MANNITYRLNGKQLNQLDQPCATSKIAATDFGPGLGVNTFEQTRIFHMQMDLPVRSDWAYMPTVRERLLRGRLLLEETLETLVKGLGLTISVPLAGIISPDDIHLSHREGDLYDPIETADGLADVKVIANGTAVQFGIPQKLVDNEVWASNMTKLDENGKPIVNRCQHQGRGPMCNTVLTSEIECTVDSHLRAPLEPHGKILKPAGYVPANIARLYVEYTKQGV